MKNPAKAQTILEYTIAITLVIVGIIIGGPYAQRAVNAHLKGWEDVVYDSMTDPLRKTDVEISGEPCDSDGVCNFPFEGIVTCCQDCGYCGDGICCPNASPPETDASCPPDCTICGDGVCSDGEGEGLAAEEMSCCQDCEGGDDPDDTFCCRDNTGNPVGRDVGSPACGVLTCDGNGYCEEDLGEDKQNCAQDCFSCNPNNYPPNEPVVYDGWCQRPYENLSNCPGDCCPVLCQDCDYSGCYQYCTDMCNMCDELCGNGNCDTKPSMEPCNEPVNCPEDCECSAYLCQARDLHGVTCCQAAYGPDACCIDVYPCIEVDSGGGCIEWGDSYCGRRVFTDVECNPRYDGGWAPPPL